MIGVYLVRDITSHLCATRTSGVEAGREGETLVKQVKGEYDSEQKIACSWFAVKINIPNAIAVIHQIG